MESYNAPDYRPGHGQPPEYLERYFIPYGDSFVLHPGELVLAPTFESVKLPRNLVGYLDGRHSLARLGVPVHVTAGAIDPGFTGTLIAELLNVGRVPVNLYPLMRDLFLKSR